MLLMCTWACTCIQQALFLLQSLLRRHLFCKAALALSLSHATLYHLGPGTHSPHCCAMVPKCLPLALPQPREQPEVRDSVQPYVRSSSIGLGTGQTHNMFLVTTG